MRKSEEEEGGDKRKKKKKEEEEETEVGRVRERSAICCRANMDSDVFFFIYQIL